MLNVSPARLLTICIILFFSGRFLYADPTPNALQVFLPQSGILDDAATSPVPATSAAGLAPSAASEFISSSLRTEIKPEDESESSSASDVKDKDGVNDHDLPSEEGGEKGIWINADPMPGCVVCNIGESRYFFSKLRVNILIDCKNSVGDLDEWSVQEHITSGDTSRFKLPVRPHYQTNHDQFFDSPNYVCSAYRKSPFWPSGSTFCLYSMCFPEYLSSSSLISLLK